MAEAIIAMFVLLGGFTVIFRLFHTALQYSNIVDAQQNKVRIALNKLEEIRAWSQSTHQPVGSVPFDNLWPYWHDQVGSDDENPEIRWKVQVVEHELYSPCRSFESIKPVDERRTMTRSCKQVIVKVNRGDPEATGAGMGELPVTLTALIGQPSLAPIPDSTDPQAVTNLQVNVAGASVTLNHDQNSGNFIATLTTTAGREILDVFFHWNTVGDAAGTVMRTGPGTADKIEVRHKILIPDGPAIYSVPGSCKALATCKYRGYNLTGSSTGTITMQD